MVIEVYKLNTVVNLSCFIQIGYLSCTDRSSHRTFFLSLLPTHIPTSYSQILEKLTIRKMIHTMILLRKMIWPLLSMRKKMEDVNEKEDVEEICN